MEPAVIVALIAAAASLAVALINVFSTRKKGESEDQRQFRETVKADLGDIKTQQGELKEQQTLALYRINQLEVKQDKSNAVKERLAETEKQIVEVDARAKSNQHRLDRMEVDRHGHS